MQLVKPDIERHFDAVQDRRLDVVERDLETGDGGGTHTATLRRSISAAPRQQLIEPSDVVVVDAGQHE
jgi:hypothetical protein